MVVCTKDRKPVLACPEGCETILQAWRQAKAWLVGRYVVMPDHIHLFCAPFEPGVELKRWVRYWKSLVSRHWPHTEQRPLWQKDFWDRQLRSTQSYRAKWEYIRQNPVRHGLVAHADQWPYTGELHVLFWHDP